MPLKVLAIKAFSDNYIWLIMDNTNQRALCIDPGEAAPVLTALKHHNCRLDGILLTHHHFDHIGGVPALKAAFPELKLFGPNDPRAGQMNTCLVEKDVFPLWEETLQFEVIETPGHTLSHLCYYESRHGWLFCGDTLFSAGCGRLFEGTPSQMRHSLDKLCQLPNDTLIFCAHEYTLANLTFAHTVEPDNNAIASLITHLNDPLNLPSLPSRLSTEKDINPFLRYAAPRVIQHAKNHGASSDKPDEIFAIIRHLKDTF